MTVIEIPDDQAAALKAKAAAQGLSLGPSGQSLGYAIEEGDPALDVRWQRRGIVRNGATNDDVTGEGRAPDPSVSQPDVGSRSVSSQQIIRFLGCLVGYRVVDLNPPPGTP